MSKMEEICSVSFVNHEAASELLREFTGKEGGLATVDWYLLRNKIADAISMARVDEREKCRQLLSEAEKREAKAKRIAANAEAYGYDHGLEAAATLLDKVADKQKLAWDAHIASGSGNAATSHEAVYRSLASQVRALQSEER